MQLQCPKCDYVWESRKESPKQCPYCNFRLWKREQVKEWAKEQLATKKGGRNH